MIKEPLVLLMAILILGGCDSPLVSERELFSAEAYANRGVAYGNKGIYDKAISDFNKAVELNPEYPDVYFNKALLCEKTGRIREAVETYKEFIQYAPPQYSRIIEHAKQRIIKLEGR